MQRLRIRLNLAHIINDLHLDYIFGYDGCIRRNNMPYWNAIADYFTYE